MNRPCMNMEVTSTNNQYYTDIHFAFATVTAGFDVDISDSKTQFDKFVGMKGFRKVLSFGGWDCSTKPETFQRFRDATKPANRGTFINSLVNFIENVRYFNKAQAKSMPLTCYRMHWTEWTLIGNIQA